jgi:hypothetical protein
MAYGQDASGTQEFACRAAVVRGTHLGRIAAGMTGCSIAFGGREVIMPTYEVLASAASAQAPAAASGGQLGARAGVIAGRAGQMAQVGRIGVAEPQIPQRPPDTAAVPDSIRRGFDANGDPYYEVTLVDGSIRRTLSSGTVVIIKPDGTQQRYPPQVIRSQAIAPDPPQLPSDPARGRAWMDRHNSDLLLMIRKLVKNDEAEMQKFSAAEAKAVGTDLFKQIVYRTTVADFLAGAR